jgi:hypothetical protein
MRGRRSPPCRGITRRQLLREHVQLDARSGEIAREGEQANEELSRFEIVGVLGEIRA